MLSRLRSPQNESNLLCRPFSTFSRWLRKGNCYSIPPLSTLAQRETIKQTGNKTYGCTSEDDIFSYKAQRWLWDEPDQLRRRYLEFDLKALIRAVEDAAGPGANCIEISKLPEGNFNKTLSVTMHDGRRLIARLPNPNAGRPHYTTASEVATMDYVRERLQIPTPKVLAYSTQASTNGIGAEYIVMEKCPGIELGRLWDDMSGRQKINVVRQVASFSARLSKVRFPYYGSLYYTKDVPDIRGTEVDDCFAVGPTTSRTWFDDKRAEVNVDRGPWTSVEDVLTAIMKRETACLNIFSDFPRDRQQGIFNGPEGYKPSKEAKLAVIEDYRRVLPFIVPKNDAHIASILWHNDLHSDNIFVCKDDPTEITGIVDWQGVHLSPAFLHVHYPSLIEYDGPGLDAFEQPQLPDNIAELDPVAQEDVRALYLAQSIWGLYQIFIQKEAPNLLRTLRYRDTLSCQIMTLIGSIFDDGEAYIQTLLSDLAEPETWEKVLKSNGQEATNVPCPLIYSHHEVSRQRDELAKWERAVELKARVIKEVGAYAGWDGAVSPGEFEVVSDRLQKAWERFVDAESTTPEERDQWVKPWPFRDG